MNSTILCLELYCSSITKKFAIVCLPFSDTDGFGVKNAKFPLDLALAFSNANTLKRVVALAALSLSLPPSHSPITTFFFIPIFLCHV